MLQFKTKPCIWCHGTGKGLDPVDVGNKMRALRKSKGIQSMEMARRLKVSNPYIWDLERGKRNWRPELVEQWKKACK